MHNLGGTDASPPCNNARNGGRFVSFGVHAIDGAIIGGVANHDAYTIKGLKFALGARARSKPGLPHGAQAATAARRWQLTE